MEEECLPSSPSAIMEAATTESQEQSMTTSSTNILTSSENTNNENREKEMLTQDDCPSAGGDKEDEPKSGTEPLDKQDETTTGENPSSDEYAKNVTYDDDGQAIYTDPKTNYQYRWSEETKSWEPVDPSTPAAANPYENEHYRWCSETNQWIPKATSTEQPGQTETEFYKWDEERKEWIPKAQSSEVTYDDEDGVYTYTDKDGVRFFWDVEKKAWFPKIDDDFMARYQLSYGFIDNTSTDTSSKSSESTPKPELKEDDKSLETAPQPTTPAAAKGLKRKMPTEPPKWFDLPPEQNTKVYVSNLPLDITEDEFVEVMSKYGLIMRDPHTNKFKIKLYAEPDGQLKGDGLCDYIKIESVDLALNLLDGSDVRGNKIKVQRATFQMRGEYNPALKPRKKKKDKEKILKMKEKLFDWRPEKMRGERSKHERVVIIKNLFTPELFDKEVQLIIEYQNDLREECVKCGTVRKVIIYDRHPEGVAQVSMSEPEEADIVVQMMNGRFFGKRKLTAEIWDGKTKYKIAETEAENKKRLSNWDKYLEEEKAALEGKAKKAKAALEEKEKKEEIEDIEMEEKEEIKELEMEEKEEIKEKDEKSDPELPEKLKTED